MEVTFKKVQKKYLPLLKQLAKSLQIEIEQDDESNYNKEFVSQILKAEQYIKEGKGKKIALDVLWK